MKRTAGCTILLCLVAQSVGAFDWPVIGPLVLAGRFNYAAEMDKHASFFPWNASTNSLSDDTRLMVSLTSKTGRFGEFYAKTAAEWQNTDDITVQKRVRFDQGDYLWRRAHKRIDYSARLFVNERRFFAGDHLSPLVDDEVAGGTGANRGVRVDTDIIGRVRLAGLFSWLEDGADGRRISFLRLAYTSGAGTVSSSYLMEDSGLETGLNQAVYKAEVSTAYRIAFAALSYEQTAFRRSTLFFPSGSFGWDRYEGDNLSHVLPEGGALFAETRLRSIPIRDVGRLRFVWRYAAVRDAFANSFSITPPPQIGHTAAAYFLADNVALNARLLYHTSVRSVSENEERDRVEGGVRGYLETGMEYLFRGGWSRIRDDASFDSKNNFVHGAIYVRLKKIRNGFHVMWKDLDTVYSRRSFGMDGKVGLSPNWGFHWRFLLSRDFQVSDAVFAQFEYRPTNRIYATAGIGRSTIGDGPFLLEDPDIEHTLESFSVYRVTLRGDF